MSRTQSSACSQGEVADCLVCLACSLTALPIPGLHPPEHRQIPNCKSARPAIPCWPPTTNSTCSSTRCPCDPDLDMSDSYFGATRASLFSGHDSFSVPISRIRCSKCAAPSAVEYVAWANANAAEAERREAPPLLATLVERDHPRHSLMGYGGMTLEELRRQVWHRVRAPGS